MRSSKSRSRSKQNRPRSIGNIVNRVFDSSGPEGKVRGTPQQIIEKYQTLARDAQLSNDRVAAENFLQHAEHYTRMLSEAMRELAAEQENRRQQHGGNGNGNGQPQGGYQDRQGQHQRRDERDDDQPDVPSPGFGLSDTLDDGGPALVETPEARLEQPVQAARGEDRPRNERRAQGEQQPRRERDERRRDERRREERRPEPVAEAAPEAEAAVAVPPEAAVAAPQSAPAADKPKRARAPRKPRAEASPEVAGNPEAAE